MDFVPAILLLSCIKALFIPAYRSTDFEVHRNWLAITHSLPISRWYYDQTSEWTLDYPPFFAYLEWVLSQIAKWFDPRMLEVPNLNYASEATVKFQRCSVIALDVLFVYATIRCVASLYPHGKRLAAGLLVMGNVGLLMVDHIHFQYNGFLFGVLLCSISEMLQKRPLRSALLFATLLNLKHIFIYIAPVYVVCLLRFYCLRDGLTAAAFGRLAKLGAIVTGVCLLSFGPFYRHLPQLLSRLFPFKRGLTHAYWAPNFWALYNVADKVFAAIVGRRGMPAASTGGLVQTFDHAILPSVTPTATFLLTGIAMLPVVIKLWTMKSMSFAALGQSFIRAIALCACTSFLFGWHVHEKAILMVTIPLTLLCATCREDTRWTIFLNVVANYSLLPLLFPPELTLIKITLHVLYTSVSCWLLLWNQQNARVPLFRWYELLYLSGFVGLCVYENVLHEVFGLQERFPFVPLLLTSVYCAVGVVYFWVGYQISFLRGIAFEADAVQQRRRKAQ